MLFKFYLIVSAIKSYLEISALSEHPIYTSYCDKYYHMSQ